MDETSRLLVAARDDSDAFAEFWRAQHRDVLAFFARRTFDPEIAADLCAETFARVLVEIRRFDPARGSARQFLFAVASGELMRWQRRRAVSRRAQIRLGIRLDPDDRGDLDRVVDVVDAAVLRADLKAALASLSAADRAAVQLRVVEGLPYPEIADTLGVSLAAARKRVSRALAALSRSLDEQLAGGAT